ncbi:MAG: hypothetical protein PHT94_00070 [Candidatus Nanoarchaeia archaeon]|nr:hypothetical protein [Candidatus Nanoarchaeia archaeon]
MDYSKLISLRDLIYNNIEVMNNKKLYIIAMERIYEIYNEIKDYRPFNLNSMQKNLGKWIEIDFKIMKNNIFEYETIDAIIYKNMFREFKLNIETIKVYYFFLKSIFELVK